MRYSPQADKTLTTSPQFGNRCLLGFSLHVVQGHFVVKSPVKNSKGQYNQNEPQSALTLCFRRVCGMCCQFFVVKYPVLRDYTDILRFTKITFGLRLSGEARAIASAFQCSSGLFPLHIWH